MNVADILVGAGVILALLLAIGAMSKSQGGCGGNCSSCSMSHSCHSEKKKE